MIRQATNTDFPELADIYHDASLIAHPFIDPEFIAKGRKKIRYDQLPLNTSFVFDVNGDIRGFVSVSNDHINGLFVKVDYQRQGIGAGLLRHVQERHDLLEACCFADNYQAQRFYHALDFEITDERQHSELPFDEYVMQWHSTS